MITKYIAIIDNPTATGDDEVDVWTDIAQAIGVGGSSDATESLENLKASLEKGLESGSAGDEWRASRAVRITIELVGPLLTDS